MKVEMQQSVQGKRRKLKKFYLIALPILLLSLLVWSGIAFAEYSAKYSNYASLAQTGVQHLRAFGIVLVIAHVERYRAIQQNPTRLAALLEQGVLAQLTIGSLVGIKGNTVCRAAEALLKKS